jgi:hypothetical protein
MRSRTAGSGSIPPRRPRPSSDCLALIGIDTREAAWKKAQAAKPRQWLEFFSFASDNGKINLDWEKQREGKQNGTRTEKKAEGR